MSAVARDRRLERLTWPEVAGAVEGGAGVVLPVGSTEQHGPHLPLATDALLAADLALAVAEEHDLLVAPTVAYGYRSRPLSGGGQGFVGTTSVSGRTLMALVEDVLGELLRHGFRRLVLLNWHFENSGFVYEAAHLAAAHRDDARIVVLEMPFQDLPDATMEALFGCEFPGWATEHAAILETSLMLHLHPDLVLWDRAVDDRSARAPWWDVVPPPDAFIPASGTLWKATRASAEKGRLAWQDIVSQVAAALGEEIPRDSPIARGIEAPR